MTQPRKYLNHLNLKKPIFGNEERYAILKKTMENGTFLPKSVEYKDIDESFKEWVENKLKISFNGKILPTMVLYSNQRFTEYTQTWKYTDDNKNLILNFKTITRENNPQYGQIQGGLWNIPGDRFYLMKKQIVLDDNGSESILALKMKQPMAVDFMFNVSIFTTNIETINDFNKLVNSRFKARQDYICPNGYYMPMTLENISDKSSYQIDDRQFYSQSFEIKVMGYVLSKEDFKVEEQPLKIGMDFKCSLSKRKANIEVEEYENPCNMPNDELEFYPKPIDINIEFPPCVKETEFTFDENVIIKELNLANVKNYSVYINGKEIYDVKDIKISNGDDIKVKITPKRVSLVSVFSFVCESTDISYSKEGDEPEIDADFKRPKEVVEIINPETEIDDEN